MPGKDVSRYLFVVDDWDGPSSERQRGKAAQAPAGRIIQPLSVQIVVGAAQGVLAEDRQQRVAGGGYGRSVADRGGAGTAVKHGQTDKGRTGRYFINSAVTEGNVQALARLNRQAHLPAEALESRDFAQISAWFVAPGGDEQDDQPQAEQRKQQAQDVAIGIEQCTHVMTPPVIFRQKLSSEQVLRAYSSARPSTRVKPTCLAKAG